MSSSATLRALGLDAAAFASDPPAPAGDLKSEVDRFTTLEACVAERAQTDPLVGDALDAIGYDTFLRDACRVLQAMKDKKRDACKPIDAEGLRARCEASVAMAISAPDECPWEIQDVPSRGRDGRCVAVASKDARLCAGAPRGEKTTCEALVLRDEAKCVGDAKCAREVKRWKNVLPAAEAAGAPLATHAKIVLRGADGTPDPAQTDTDLSNELSRGVVLFTDVLGTHLQIGTPQELGATSFAPPPTTRTRVAFDLLVPSDKPASIDHAELAVPGGTTIVLPGARWDGALTLTKLEQKRGGDVALSAKGKIGGGSRAYTVELTVTTFVRDVARSATSAVPKKK